MSCPFPYWKWTDGEIWSDFTLKKGLLHGQYGRKQLFQQAVTFWTYFWRVSIVLRHTLKTETYSFKQLCAENKSLQTILTDHAQHTRPNCLSCRISLLLHWNFNICTVLQEFFNHFVLLAYNQTQYQHQHSRIRGTVFFFHVFFPVTAWSSHNAQCNLTTDSSSEILVLC